MKRKLMLGTMILGLSMAGAAWAQPAPDHDRNATVYRGYGNYRTDVDRGRRGEHDDACNRGYSPYYQRGDADRDDGYGAWNARGGDRDRRILRNDNGRGSWGHTQVRRGDRDDR